MLFWRFVACSFYSFVALSGQAGAVTPGFVEDFANGNSNWLNSPGDGATVLATAIGSGGPDGGSFIQGTHNFVNTTVDDDGTNIFRARDEANSSNGQLFGDWINAGVREVSFVVRHDATDPTTGDPLDLNFFVRVATETNFPAASIVSVIPVPANEWTALTYDVGFGNPLLFLEGPPTPQFYTDVFGSVSRVQIGSEIPTELIGVDRAFKFEIDKVALVPEPGTLAILAIGVVFPCGRYVFRSRQPKH